MDIVEVASTRVVELWNEYVVFQFDFYRSDILHAQVADETLFVILSCISVFYSICAY